MHSFINVRRGRRSLYCFMLLFFCFCETKLAQSTTHTPPSAYRAAYHAAALQGPVCLLLLYPVRFCTNQDSDNFDTGLNFSLFACEQDCGNNAWKSYHATSEPCSPPSLTLSSSLSIFPAANPVLLQRWELAASGIDCTKYRVHVLVHCLSADELEQGIREARTSRANRDI
ncbi:hypothetical protein V8C44DRAFT_328339 [Trichoderma aethiopicum]